MYVNVENAHRLQTIVRNIEGVTGITLRIKINDRIGYRAYVLRNRTIEIGDNLIERSSDDEIAAVIAHEAAHLLLDHGKKQDVFDDKERNNVKQRMHDIFDKHEEKGGMYFIGYIKVFFTFMKSAFKSTIRMRSYHRVLEKKADELAMEIALKAGYDKFALADILEKTSILHTRNTWWQRAFSTHPKATERISIIRKRK